MPEKDLQHLGLLATSTELSAKDAKWDAKTGISTWNFTSLPSISLCVGPGTNMRYVQDEIEEDENVLSEIG